MLVVNAYFVVKGTGRRLYLLGVKQWKVWKHEREIKEKVGKITDVPVE